MPLARTGPSRPVLSQNLEHQGKLAHGLRGGAILATANLDFKQQLCNANAEKSPVCQPRAPTPGLRAGPLALFRSLMIACSEGGRRNDAKGGRCHTALRTLARLLQKLNARRRRR